jgi:predicted amidophosphoribosyltransferase
VRLIDLVLPHRCPVCGDPGRVPCRPCESALPAPPDVAPPPGLDACHSVVAYHGPGRAVVASLKFGGAMGILPWVAEHLAGRLEPGPALDVVTWVPTIPAHRRRRGRDQAEALARSIAHRLGLPARPLLLRLPGPPQAGRSAGERRLGPPLSARGRSPAAVLVVDDVVTTGGSLAAAARALRAAGARTVGAAAVARTPATWAQGRGDAP